MQDLTPGRHSGEPDAPAPLIPVERQPLAPRDAYGVPGYPQEHYEEGDDLGQTLRYYIGLVLKHKRLILGAALLALTIGGLFTLMKTPLYTATVRIQIDREAVKVVESGATTSGEANAYDYLNTQYELLQSLAMAERVAASLSLEKDDSFFEARGQSLTGLVRSALFPAPEGPETTQRIPLDFRGEVTARNANLPIPRSCPRRKCQFLPPSPGRRPRSHLEGDYSMF